MKRIITLMAMLAAVVALGCWGLIMVCDEDPNNEKTLTLFLGTKVAGMVLFAACLMTGKHLYRQLKSHSHEQR